MSPEQLSFMIGSIYGSTLTLLLFPPNRRSRLFRDRRSAKRPTTPKPSFAELLMPPPRDQDPDWRRSFNHDNTNKKPTSASRPLLFRRRPPEDAQ